MQIEGSSSQDILTLQREILAGLEGPDKLEVTLKFAESKLVESRGLLTDYTAKLKVFFIHT
jgi:hypothetical protein